LKNSKAIFQAGKARSRVKRTRIGYEIQIMAARRGLSQRMRAVTPALLPLFKLFDYIVKAVEKEYKRLFNWRTDGPPTRKACARFL